MPTLSEFLAYVISLVGVWIDQDGAYGAQCVDLILRVYVKFWNYFAWGNAIDFTRNGMPAGFTRGTPAQMGVCPGDILVWHFGPNDEYGHIGICIAVNSDGTVTSVEQNIDGTPETGGPGRYKTRNLTYCVAVIRPAFAPEAQATSKEEQLEDEDMSMTFIKIAEDIDEKVKRGNIYLVNAGARVYKHLSPNEFNTARAAYPNAQVLTATKAVNYFALLISALGAKEI